MKQLLLTLLVLCSMAAMAQQQKLDSLLRVNNNYKKNDSIKVANLINVFRQYTRMNDMANVGVYGAKAEAVALTLPGTGALIRVYEKLGLCYHGKGMYVKAIENYNKGIAVAQQQNDKATVADFYINLTALYGTLPDYTKALEVGMLAVNIYSELNDAGNMASCYMNIGEIYNSLGQTPNAINYVEKALLNFNTIRNGYNYGSASAYSELGDSYLKATDAELLQLGTSPTERYTKAMDFYNKALHIAEKDAEAMAMRPTVLINIGDLTAKMGDEQKALQYYQRASLIIDEAGDKIDQANIAYTLGNYYYSIHDVPASVRYLHQSLAIGNATGMLAAKAQSLSKLSEVFESEKNYDSAYNYYRQYIAVRDEIFNAEKEKEITRKQLKLDFAVKENDFRLERELTDAKLRQQTTLARQQQQELLLRQQTILFINKEKDFQRLRYMKDQAALQNEQRLQAATLQQNKLQAKLDKEISNKQIGAQQAQIRYDSKVKLFSFLALALLLAVASWIYYSKRKTAKLNEVISAQKATLEQLGQVKDKIFSVVSHDMRSPVNSLKSFIDILENGNIPQEKLAIYSKELKKNLSYTSSLMNNLLTWAASQMQGFKPVMESFDVGTVVAEVVQSVQPNLLQKDMYVVNSVTPKTMVVADKNMVAAIVRNLMNNAIKYSFKGGAINVSVRTAADHWMLSIADEGTGMDAAQLEKFNSSNYMPAESKRGTANEKGTGLGLMLCKTFAEQMGGEMQASNGGKGTVMQLRITN